MDNSNTTEVSEVRFPVVGIGASAGGLEAIKGFLKALPANPGMAFVFVQHLSPEHTSILPEILQRFAPFPVHQITDNLHLEKDNLYIIPENKTVTAVDGVLKLAPLDSNHRKSSTIDLFFSSLGVVHQCFAVGIVLSGSLNDGTVGMQVIKSYGGLTFAQDGGSAAFESMPNSAVRAGVVDFVLPPAQIAERLIATSVPFHNEYTPKEIADTLPDQDKEVFKHILTVLRVRRGVDFTYYKQSTLKRRIVRRMALSKIDKPIDYLAFLRENKNEQDALYNDMLISVTNFFRDKASFDFLCSTLLPRLLATKKNAGALRLWVAGCATGEEAYSIAMCLQEFLGDRLNTIKIQIFATDISELAIEKARTGVYRAADLDGISPARIQQFFQKMDGSYQVSKSIREMCVFAHHNLLKDPPFSRIDLVSCRNVMIYLEPVLQKRALTTFHYALNDKGYLMLGKSETVGNNTDIFTALSSGDRIYTPKGLTGRTASSGIAGAERNVLTIDENNKKDASEKDVYKIADEAMLANFMPPSVLVNEKFDVVQFRGSIETWLIPPSGKPSFNVLKMARDGLSFELRSMLQQAQKSGLPSKKYGLFFKAGDFQHYVNINVWPLKETSEPYYLIVFHNASATGLHAIPAEVNPARVNESYDENALRVEQLEKELIQSRADMRLVTEEQETANEELQSANEELLSGREELQSLNEELETSKEELQSTNEEILIVNNELVDRNEQLNSNRQYLEGIVNTLRDPLLVLDGNLRVKRATNGYYNKFSTTEAQTENKYIYELGDRQWDIPQLREILENILPAKSELQDFEVTHVFPSLGLRTMVLNARQLNNVNGEKLIILAFEDTTAARQVASGLAETERLLMESRDRLKFAVDSAGLGTWDYDPHNQLMHCDQQCLILLGLPKTASISRELFLSMVLAEDRGLIEQDLSRALAGEGSGTFSGNCRIKSANDGIKWLNINGQAYFDADGIPNRFLGTALDVTEQISREEANRELLDKKDEFISIASHELKTPITSIKAALQIIQRIYRENTHPEQAGIFIHKAIKQIDKLIELVKDLLDVTKVQSHKLELNKTTFRLSELISECAEEIQAANPAFKLITEGNGDFEVYADRNRLEQVIINLLANAVKYSPGADSIIINISKTNSNFKIAVTDFGIGIANDKLPLLFGRFYRVDENSQQYAGLGLGLYISCEIIERHNGQIEVVSEPGRGSTFWFTLPLATAEE